MLFTLLLSFVAIGLLLYFIYWTDVVIHWSDPITSYVHYKHLVPKQDSNNNTVPTEEKMLVIGAGFTGLAMQGALKRHDVPFDAVEYNSEVGGNWYNGVYECVNIISSKKTTEYKDWRMPDSYPDFPRAEQMWTYMNNYCDHFNLREHISFNTEVVKVEAIDQGRKWKVTLKDLKSNSIRDLVYKGVVVANGHHWDKRMPKYNGQEKFTGEIIHSKDYKKPDQLRGKRVLVIGGGNSACDISVEGSRFALESHISLRRGYWFLPRTAFGTPIVELVRPWMPMWLQRIILNVGVRLIFGKYEQYGLQHPDHRIFEHHPTINSELLNHIKLGRVIPHKDIDCFLGGKKVRFVDGTELEVDLIVTCTGYHVSIPMLQDYVKVINNVPQLIAALFVPNYYNIYVLGLGQPRYGAGPLLTASAELVAKIILLQKKLTTPYSKLIMALGQGVPSTNKHSPDLLVDPHVAYKQSRLAILSLPLIPFIEKLLLKLNKLQE